MPVITVDQVGEKNVTITLTEEEAKKLSEVLNEWTMEYVGVREQNELKFAYEFSDMISAALED